MRQAALLIALLLPSPAWSVQEDVPRIEIKAIRPGAQAIAPITASGFQPFAESALPQDLAIDAVSNQEVPQAKAPETSFEGLDRFHQDIQMSARDGGEGPRDPGFQRFWDGVRHEEFAHEEELVYVEVAQKKQEAVQYAHEEFPALDYRRNRFNKEDAEAFLAETHEFEGGGQAAGRELLGLLVTPEAVDIDGVFDPTRVDMTRFGVSDTDLRPLLKEKDIPVYSYHAFLGQAFNYGLVYRVSDNENRKTYHGVPPHVRQALGLHPEQEPQGPEPKAKPAEASAFSHALAALAHEAESLPPKEELFEFTAQIVEAAVKAGHMKRDQLSEAFERRSLSIDFETPSMEEALLTLLESSHGTPWFDKALGLCRHAVAAGALNQRQLDEALKGI